MTVWADLLVRNAGDVTKAREGLIPESDVREATVHFKVDTGSHKNVINLDVLEALGLNIINQREYSTAGGGKTIFGESEGMDLHWKNHHTIMDALVSLKPSNNLLSVSALESMGLKVDPINLCLQPAFPNGIMGEVE